MLDLIECGKLNQNESLRKLILVSAAPVDTAAKLSANYRALSQKEKEIARELISASDFCEEISADLVSIVASFKNIESLLKSVDVNGAHFVDVLVDCNQKKVISHFAVQQYFSDLWDNGLKISGIKMTAIFLAMFLCPLLWLILALPLPLRWGKNGLIVNRVPVIKFFCFFSSHLYFIALLFITSIVPIIPIPSMSSSIPYYHEWVLLAWISGLLVAELSNPSDKGGLGMLKIIVLIISTVACICHTITFAASSTDFFRYDLLFARNILFAVALLISSVQILDFLTFHHLFGPWAIIISELMIDLLRFLVILALFLFGYSCLTSAVYQDVYPDPNNLAAQSGADPTTSLKNPIISFQLLFFALFGLSDPSDLPVLSRTPIQALYVQKAVFGSYLVVAIIVMINTLIAMLANTYDRIEEQSDIEWKYGRAKLIRNMTKASTNAPAPLNLLVEIVKIARALWKFNGIFSFFLNLFYD